MILLYLFFLLACVALAISSVVGRARGWTPPVEPSRYEALAAWAALLVAAMVSLWIVFVPLVSTQSTSIGSTADDPAVEQRRTLLQSGERTILPVLASVLGLAAAPVALRRRRARYWVEMSGALVLAALSLLAGFSIGLFLLPIGAFMFCAALAGRVAHRTA